jgi:ABC transporter substrate binding protein (PQQ-dependent alcohol dehydrogenase system)
MKAPAWLASPSGIEGQVGHAPYWPVPDLVVVFMVCFSRIARDITLTLCLALASALALSTCLTLAPSTASAADQGTAVAPAGAAPPPAEAPAATKPEGGAQVQMPQSPAMTPVPIGYLRQIVEHPRPSSRMDVEPDDAGIAGAKMALDENNSGGQFTGDLYSLDVSTVATTDAAVAALQKFLESGHHFVIVDAPAATLIKLSDWAKGKDILLLNVRATDISLRQEDCRANILHIVPDRYMLADALAQYLVANKWSNWLLVRGTTSGDAAYADAIKRAAKRFGATIVDEREYRDTSGGKRDAMGTIPPPKDGGDNAAHAAPDYQVIIVADEDQLWGPFLPYRGGTSHLVPVAGTAGLVATTWSPGHEKWGATQANNHFQKDYKRLMLPIDYQGYVASRTIGEAVTRNHGADFPTIAAFIIGDEFQLAPFKGVKQTYRKWDGQFRQPILIATDKVPVSLSPQPGVPPASHPDIDMDTLGIDQPESKCKM